MKSQDNVKSNTLAEIKSLFPTFSIYLGLNLSALIHADTPGLSSFAQGEVLPKNHYPAAYNAPSQVELQSNDERWLPDLYIDAAFLYYHADEEGLELATSAAIVSATGGFAIASTSNSRTLLQNSSYEPSFQVGLGTRFDDWTLDGKYTWIRQTNHTHQSAPDPKLAGGIGVWVLSNWFEQNSPLGQSISATTLSSRWKLAMDLADLCLSRPYYQGSRLSISPSIGLQAAWIRQKMRIAIQIPSELIADLTSEETVSHTLSHSWGVGPRAGLQADLLLESGFYFDGVIAASLLFTQYNLIKHYENVASTSTLPATLKSRYPDYNCLRPILEMALGTGFRTYVCKQQYHIDVSAAYDFLMFWNQNMIRKLMDSTHLGVNGAAGNLNLHGLRISASFDF